MTVTGPEPSSSDIKGYDIRGQLMSPLDPEDQTQESLNTKDYNGPRRSIRYPFVQPIS